MTSTAKRLSSIDYNLARLLEVLEAKDRPVGIGEVPVDLEERLRAANPFPNRRRVYAGDFDDVFDRKAAERELGLAEVQHPLARVAVLAVSLNLKNRLDAKRTIDGADVLDVIARYADVQALRDLLGPVTDEELEKATALYDTLAT